MTLNFLVLIEVGFRFHNGISKLGGRRENSDIYEKPITS